MPLRTRCGTSRLPCMSLGVRAQGLGPRGGGTALAITICSVLPSVPYDAVGPPKFILLSRLNIQPARLPVNASPLLSRTTTHDSGPIWFATPSLGGTCTRETYRFVPAHRVVKWNPSRAARDISLFFRSNFPVRLFQIPCSVILNSLLFRNRELPANHLKYRGLPRQKTAGSAQKSPKFPVFPCYSWLPAETGSLQPAPSAT